MRRQKRKGGSGFFQSLEKQGRDKQQRPESSVPAEHDLLTAPPQMEAHGLADSTDTDHFADAEDSATHIESPASTLNPHLHSSIKQPALYPLQQSGSESKEDFSSLHSMSLLARRSQNNLVASLTCARFIEQKKYETVQEGVAVLDLLTLEMEGLNSPIYFRKCSQVPTTTVLYIHAIHELMLLEDEQGEEVAQALLRNINYMVSKSGFVYINSAKDEMENFLEYTAKILHPENFIEKIIKWQIATKMTLQQFKLHCEALNYDTVYIGGVYGRACVWNVARQLGLNIYAKQLGDEHPNTRFKDEFLFKNAVIVPAITEGYSEAIPELENYDDSFTFKDFICFTSDPDTLWPAEIREAGDYEDLIENIYTEDEVGASYDKHYSEVHYNNAERHEELFNRIEQLIQTYDLKKSSQVNSNNSINIKIP